MHDLYLVDVIHVFFHLVLIMKSWSVMGWLASLMVYAKLLRWQQYSSMERSSSCKL
jgi:hypothetical protein